MSDKDLNQEDVDNVDIETVEEETSNAATISGNPTVSRSDLIAKMVSYASAMNKDTLAQAVETMTKSNDEIYQSTQQTAGDTSSKNKASIKSSSAPSMPMASVKEDLALLFGDSTDLSEDFRLRTEALFEAAVSTRVNLEVVKIEEQIQLESEKLIEDIKQEMEENIDAYLNYAVAEWISENKLAVESNIKTEIAESFLTGLKSLFEDHYVDIPDDKIDVVEALSAQIAELELQFNEAAEKNHELLMIVSEKQVKEVSDKLSEGMTDTQKEKFTKLVEAVDYDSADEFNKKANIIKETYFTSKNDVKVISDQLLNEFVEESEVTARIDPEMAAYVNSISRTVKK